MTSKKTLYAVLSCMTALSMLCACSSGTSASSSTETASSEATASSGHTHTASVWDRDINEHWQLCDCGETFNTGDHTLGEDIVCTECGSEIWMSEDGASIENYNENGDWTRSTTYDADGNVIDDYRWDYEPGPNGGYEKVSSYYNDSLVEEINYNLDSNGAVLTFEFTTYYDDGTYSVGEYYENYEPIISYQYSADGTETYRSEYEYAEADGVRYLAKSCAYHDGVLGLVQEFNQYGDDILFREIDADGNTVTEMSHEYTYNEDGTRESMKFFVDGVLVQESFYTTTEDGGIYDHLMNYYNEDGTKSVSEYNSYGDILKDTIYDASGNVLEEYTYENEYTEEGDMLSQKMYLNGALAMETLYTIEIGEDYEYHYMSSEIVYNEDGTKVVSEYNMDDELIKETVYDANGNIIE